MIRIVKMTFEKNKVDKFIAIFNRYKEQIRNFDGVEHLDLLRDKNNSNIFFTYSIWKKEENLAHYRNSDLFKNVWSKTKPLFSEKPEAWSLGIEGSRFEV